MRPIKCGYYALTLLYTDTTHVCDFDSETSCFDMFVPPGIRHNTLSPLVVEHLYNRDVRTDNAIITPVSTVESKKKTISRVPREKSILHTTVERVEIACLISLLA